VSTSLTNTMRGSPVVVAPGKVFLVGEYAVLDGGPAVLAAVTRYALAQYLPDLTPETPLIEETVRRAVDALGDLAQALPTGSVLVNTADFRHRLFKLGLGSSAASAVAAVGAVFELAGLRVASARDRVFSLADEGHRVAQGGVGSGADVAAAVHGGFIGFVRPLGGRAVITRLTAPTALHMVVFWSGRASSTPHMIQAVSAFAERDPVSYRWLIGKLRAIAERFIQAFTSSDARGAIAEADAYGRLLEKLGHTAGVTIVTPPFVQAAELARHLGGTAKTSGAGGGDIGVALFADPEAAVEFRTRCPGGVSVLDVGVDTEGVRRRAPHTVDLM